MVSWTPDGSPPLFTSSGAMICCTDSTTMAIQATNDRKINGVRFGVAPLTPSKCRQHRLSTPQSGHILGYFMWIIWSDHWWSDSMRWTVFIPSQPRRVYYGYVGLGLFGARWDIKERFGCEIGLNLLFWDPILIETHFNLHIYKLRGGTPGRGNLPLIPPRWKTHSSKWNVWFRRSRRFVEEFV